MAARNRAITMKRFILIPGLMSLFFFSNLANAQETENFTAVVGALDKITARITQVELAAGERVAFGTLWMTARACYKRPPEETPETYIYLIIENTLADGTEVQVFEGWMLESSPALNAVEHAVYDVWAIDCRMEAPEASEGSS